MVYAVMATGAWAYLLPNFLALQDTVKELETQVDKLESAVTVLEGQVDRYEAENAKLEENLEEFEEQNKQLQLSNALYSKLTTRLNTTVEQLEEQNEILVASNDEYSRLNDELNNTAMILSNEVDTLEAAIDDIGETALEAARINDEFLDEAEVLEGLNGTLTEQVDTINGVIIDMNGEISRLEDLVDELRTILAFLDDAAEDIGESYEEIAAFLADQIETNQKFLIETLQNTYQQTASNWVCSFQSFFSGDAFINNPDSPIGAAAYTDVIEYVEDNVLVPLCLDRTDFEAFLAADNDLADPPVDVTVNQLISSVSEYTTAALNYYFPDEGETGLTDEDWEAAGYQCSGLPDESKFTMMTVSV
jgi:predicted RNase H-like nuclease (RuvC/YqgF family)